MLGSIRRCEPDTLSDWIKIVRSFVRTRIAKVKGSLSTKPSSILSDPELSIFLTHTQICCFPS